MPTARPSPYTRSMTNPSPRRGRSAGPGRLTLSEIAVLVGVCVKTLRRRIIPGNDAPRRQYWVRTLDLQKRRSGVLGLIHGDAGLVRRHLSEIRGVDESL